MSANLLQRVRARVIASTGYAPTLLAIDGSDVKQLPEDFAADLTKGRLWQAFEEVDSEFERNQAVTGDPNDRPRAW